MSRNDEMAELCEGIAQVLEEKGHTTKAMYNGAGNVCLLGAGRLAQGSPLMNGPQKYDRRSRAADLNTAEALGFSEPQKVAEHNDGYTLRTRSVVPVPFTPTFVHKDEAYVPMIYREEEVIEEVVHPAISQQQAIDLAMDRAKYWRNQ